MAEERSTPASDFEESRAESTETRSSEDRRPRGRSQGRPRRGGGRRPRGRARRTTGCSSRCVGKQMSKISYKNVDALQRYITDRGKIRPRRQTGNCAKHQRALARAIKQARFMALLPYTADHSFTSERRAPERRR